MEASEQIHYVLKHDADVSDITNTIRPIELGEHDMLPAITYEIDDTDAGQTFCGDTAGLDRVRVIIDVWVEGSPGAAYKQAHELANAVRRAMRSGAPLKDDPSEPRDYLRAQFSDAAPHINDGTKRHGWTLIFYIWQYWS